MASPVAPLDEDRVRVRRWEATGVELAAVVGQLHALRAELTQHDAAEQEHPHSRNCVLNLVVGVQDSHRAEACDRLIASLAATHPLRAIIIHLHGGKGNGILDAEITAEAHQLVTGFPVQREQILLHVRGDAAHHLSSLVEPLLVSDVPTYLWWSGPGRLDEERLRDAMTFLDVLVVDSARFEHPVGSLLQLAGLAADPDASISVADLRWSRMRPWRDAIGQFFAPEKRRPLLAALREVRVDAAGTAPDARVGGAMLAGWLGSALGWHLTVTRSGEDATEVVAETGDGHRVELTLRSLPNERLHHGELLAVHLAGRAGPQAFSLAVERDPDAVSHAHATIELGVGEPLRQQLPLPRMDDSDLLLQVLWANQRDPVFRGALTAAATLLEAMR